MCVARLVCSQICVCQSLEKKKNPRACDEKNSFKPADSSTKLGIKKWLFLFFNTAIENLNSATKEKGRKFTLSLFACNMHTLAC